MHLDNRFPDREAETFVADLELLESIDLNDWSDAGKSCK